MKWKKSRNVDEINKNFNNRLIVLIVYDEPTNLKSTEHALREEVGEAERQIE